MILHLSRMRRNVNRNVFNCKNVSATPFHGMFQRTASGERGVAGPTARNRAGEA